MRGQATARRILTAAVVLCLAFTVTSGAIESRTAEIVRDEWFTYTLDAVTAGWVREVVHRTAEHYRTTQTVVLRVARAGQVTEMTRIATYIEKHEGTPVKISLREVEGTMSVTHEWDFTGAHVTHSVTQFGRTRSSEHPHPEGAWLMPKQRVRHVREQVQAGVDRISYRTVAVEFGLSPVSITEQAVGETTFEFGDREIPVSIWEQRIAGVPVLSVLYRMREGQRVYARTPMGFGVLEELRTDRATALQAMRGSPAELIAGMMVVPDSPIKDVGDTSRVTLRLRVREGALPELPEAGGQRILERREDSIVTRFELGDPLPALDHEIDDPDYREPSAMVDFEDPVLSQLVEATTPDEPVAKLEFAESLRAVVYEYITVKDLGVGYGTASVVARERRGDCTEHAVLLVALLRGHGIPARAATGLVYMEDPEAGMYLFGWHMWVQALIDGYWIDLEPSWPQGLPHAAYVLTSVSSLADRDDPAELTTALQLAGNLEIEVVGVCHGGTARSRIAISR